MPCDEHGHRMYSHLLYQFEVIEKLDNKIYRITQLSISSAKQIVLMLSLTPTPPLFPPFPKTKLNHNWLIATKISRDGMTIRIQSSCSDLTSGPRAVISTFSTSYFLLTIRQKHETSPSLRCRNKLRIPFPTIPICSGFHKTDDALNRRSPNMMP